MWYELEVDFVAKNEQGKDYIQVSATVRDEKTLERELRPLEKISDNYPKCIMTLDAYELEKLTKEMEL